MYRNRGYFPNQVGASELIGHPTESFVQRNAQRRHCLSYERANARFLCRKLTRCTANSMCDRDNAALPD